MPEDHKKHLHKSTEDSSEAKELKEEEEKEEAVAEPSESDLSETESIKTFVREPELEEEMKVEADPESESASKDQSPHFRTTNIDLDSQHSLDDLAAETSSQESPTFPMQASTTDEGPHIPPLGSRMHPGVVSAHKQANSNKPVHLIILVLVGLGVIGATVYLLKGGSLSKPTPSPTPEASVAVASPTPSPSPVVVIDRSKFSIRVLNGTAKSGLAASVSARLKALGYLTEKTGNATNSAFTQTVIRVKSAAIGLLEQLIKDLQPDFEATSSSSLQVSDSADAEVVIGAK